MSLLNVIAAPFGGHGTVNRYAGRRWLASLVISCAVYCAIGAAVIVAGRRKAVSPAQKVVDVTFVEKVVKPPPEPLSAPEVKPQPAAAAPAPAVRPEQKVHKLEKAPPPKALVAPRKIPKIIPPEADPSEDKGVASFGDEAKPDPAGLEGGVAQGGTIGGIAGGVVELPDGAIPPRPKSTNAIPAYPAAARADGRTGAVVLEIAILADGSVDRIKVVRGDEPFASAAVNTVKTWRYEPARYKGQPISVYRTFQITFKLTG